MNNKSAILIETTANTTDNLRPRSGSWSGYQYYSTQPPLLPPQQQPQPTSHEYNKPIKQTFLTKFIQKRPPTNPSQHEPQPIPTMQPMLSTPLLKKQDLKKKKGGSFGRFLKKFNKNPSDKTTTSDNTLMEISDENEMDKKDEDMVPKHINDNETNANDNHDNDIRNNSQQQPIDDNMLINDAMKMPRQTHKPTIVHENFGHADYHQPIVPTFNNNTMIPDFNSHHEHHHHHHHHPYANNISTDDIHLKYQYNYKPDVAMYTPLVPRSTSFDVNRSSHSPPPIRLFTPLNQNSLLKPTTFINNNNPIHHDNNSNNNNNAIITANTTNTTTITEDDPTYSKKPTLEEDLIEDEDDDDDTNDSIDSDMEDHINVERLSKRLSGGHYGSAGGLIVNTLSLSEIAKHDYIQNNNNNNNEDTEEETEEEEIKQETVNSELKQNENQDESEINDINSNSNNNKISDYINNGKSDIIENEKQISSSSSITTSLSPMETSPVIVEENNISKLGHAGNNESEPTSTKEITTLIEHKKDNEDNFNKQSIDNDSSMKQEAEKNHDIESDNDDDDNTSIEMKTEDLARRILELDDTVYHDLEHVAEWIGDGSLASNQILKHYMALFDFTNRRLEDSFRQLCGKLPMKAESQQIDRILEEFSKRYWDCNQSELFGSSDVIHAIIYSLVLLNTDLHIAQGEHKKMSRPAFVRNTMDAIRSQLDVLNKDSLILEEEDKHASFLSLQSTSQQSSSTTPQEWAEIKRTPSVRSAYSQHSGTHHPSSSKYTSMDTMMMKTSSPTSPASSTIIIGSKTWQSDMETLLKQMYNSIRHRQLLHPTFKNNIVDQADLKRNSLNGSSSKLSPFKRGIGSTMWKAARESLFLSDSHSHSTTTLSTEVDYAQQPLSPRSAVSSLSGTFPRRRSISSIRSGLSHHSQYTNHGNGTTTYQAVASLLHHSNLPTSFTSSAPYYKEGLIARKHLMERANHKARQRDWKECFMVVDRGELRMYRLDGQSHGRRKINNHHHNNNSSLILGSNNSRQQHLQGMISRGSLATVSESISSFDPNSEVVLGGGDWLANAQIIGEIDLKHTLANSLPSGYNRQRQHAFALQQSNGGVYLFQVGSAEQVLEWVDTCNYWAARESKEPLLGGVGNVEYGWGACLNGISDEDDDNDHVSPSSSAIIVHQWQPPFPPMVASVLGEVEQLDALHQHIKSLNKELDNHRDIKHKMEKKFPRKTSDHVCAMSNFENKTQYLLHEIIKYQNYCDSIEKSLDLQDKALDEKKQQQLSSEEMKSTTTTTAATTTTTTTTMTTTTTTVESKPTTTIIV